MSITRALFLFLVVTSLAPSRSHGKAIKKVTPVTLLPEVVTKIQKAWDKAANYQADFKQVVSSKRLGTNEETSGKLSVVKPGKLRWESETDKNVQILNGKKFINIHVNARRGTRTVDIYQDITGQMDAKMLEFLAGKAKFKEWYRPSLVKETAEIIELKLTPRDSKKAAPEDVYIAEFDKKGYILRALANETLDSRVRIDFSNIQTNLKLSEDLFEYKPEPKDVVHKQ